MSADNGRSVAYWAHEYARLHLPVFPCAPDTKSPITKHGFKDAVDDSEQIDAWWTADPLAMIGMPTGARTKVFVLDVDLKVGRDGEASLAALIAKNGPLPETRIVTTGSGGRHIYFQHPGFKISNSVSKIAEGLDIRGDGGYVILPPSVRADGTFYEWAAMGEIAPAPQWLIDLIRIPDPAAERYPAPNLDNIPEAYARAALEKEGDLTSALKPGNRNHQLNVSAFNLGQLVPPLTRGQIEAVLFNACMTNGLVAEDGKSQVLATIYSGLEAGLRNPRKIKEKLSSSRVNGKHQFLPGPKVNGDLAAAHPSQNEIEVISPNEDSIALAFASIYCDTLRYCHDWGFWLKWCGTHWHHEKTKQAFDYARALARTYNAKNDRSLAKSATASGVERYAQSDRRLATTSDAWDQDHWVLATPDGTVDLRTGTLRDASPDDHITKITACGLGNDCPTWIEFLEQATDHDAALMDYLQRVAGYCLTGSVKEHALFFVYGEGGNGKGTFINAIQAILSDYARVAQMDTFAASKNDKHPTEIAFLRGARLVTAQETEEDRHWADVKIKALTGGDPITAHFMRQDPFTFLPTFKLLFAGNHKPALRTVDEAIRRRFQIIPFINKPAKPDDMLSEKLQAEYPGILSWMIEGCLNWQKVGLQPPPVVTDATSEYFEEQNTFQQWLNSCCEIGMSKTDTSARLFGSWKRWCESNGEKAGSSKAFAERLKTAHFKKDDTRTERRFKGLSLIVEIPDDMMRYGDN